MARDGANVRLWIRRAHLYTGLALLPWVRLYAAGVFMWWQMRRVRRVGWLVIGAGPPLVVVVLAEVVPPLLS